MTAPRFINFENDGYTKKQLLVEHIIGFVKRTARGLPIKDPRRKAVGNATLQRWRFRYADVEVTDAMQLRQLEADNTRLKKPVAKTCPGVYGLDTVFSTKPWPYTLSMLPPST
jgi:putative transposase